MNRCVDQNSSRRCGDGTGLCKPLTRDCCDRSCCRAALHARDRCRSDSSGHCRLRCCSDRLCRRATVRLCRAGRDRGGIFGLALLFLLDLSEFTRRFRGAKIANDVLQSQLVYWLERAAIISGIVIVLALAGFIMSSLVPPSGRTIISGLGALLAFAGAIYSASTRAR